MTYFKRISVMLLSLLFLIPSFVQAAEFNFSVETVQPESQVDKQKTYFDIQVEPNEKQELTIHMRNDTSKDVVINPKISSATTNMNGVVEYSPNKLEKDKSLVYDLVDLVKTEKEITIPKNGSYDLKLQVTAPDKTFDGLVTGGITLKENAEDKTADSSNNDAGLAIDNEFSYVVAIVLHSKKGEIKPNLNLTKSFPDQVNVRNVIMNNLQNDTPTYINDLKVISKIYKQGSDKVLYEFTKDNSMQVAPNTNFNLPVPLNGEELKAGKYDVKITAFAEEDANGEFVSGKTEAGVDQRYLYKWDLTSEFEITKEIADKLNKQDVSIEKDYTLWYIIGGFLAIILALIIIIIVILKKKNKSEEEKA